MPDRLAVPSRLCPSRRPRSCPSGCSWRSGTSVTLGLCPSPRTPRVPSSATPAESGPGHPRARPALGGLAQPGPEEDAAAPAANKWGRVGGASSAPPGRGRGACVGFRPPPAAIAGPAPAADAQVRQVRAGPAGRGSRLPFWPLSAAYQDSERKAHRQKSSSVRKVPLRSLISSDARRAPAGPRLHGPGNRGRGAGVGRRRLQGPRPRGGEGRGARGRAGTGPGSAPAAPQGASFVPCTQGKGTDSEEQRQISGSLQVSGARNTGGLASAAGPGQAGLGWAGRREPRPGLDLRPGSGAAAESTAQGGAARI